MFGGWDVIGKARAVGAIAVFCLFGSGCGSGARAVPGYPALATGANAQRELAPAAASLEPVEFYFYVNSDNDIFGANAKGDFDYSGEIVADALRAFPVMPGVGLHVYLDRGPLLAGHGGDPIDSEIDERCGDQVAKTESLGGETDSADPRYLRELLARRCFPAAKRFVVLWSHGDGFRAQDDFDRTTGRKPFHVSALLSAIPDGFAEAVLFDSCSMADLEIASLLEKKAKFMVASQYELPNTGIQYASLPATLAKTRDTRAILAQLREDSEKAFADMSWRSPLVILELAKLPAVRAAFASAYATFTSAAKADYVAARAGVLRERDGDLFFLFSKHAPGGLKTLSAALDSGRGSLHFALPRAPDSLDEELEAVATSAPGIFRTWSENFPNWAAYARVRSSLSASTDVPNQGALL